RGLRMSLNAFSGPSSSGQKAVGTTPLGLKMNTSRCLRRFWLAKPRPGRFRMNGSAAALRPRSRMNSRRVLFTVTSLLHGARLAQGGRRHDLHHQLADIITMIGERLP